MISRTTPYRVYVDTSVIGGCFDDEFRHGSVRLIESAKAGETILVISDVTVAELERAPERVRDFPQLFAEAAVERVYESDESQVLAREYLAERVLAPRMLVDARHIAIATVCKVDVLVSWNFKHIVNLERIHGYNAVNLRAGYPMLEIRSPLELANYED